MATTRNTATMAAPTSAVVLRRSRRIAIATGDSTPLMRPVTAIGNSASPIDPPLMIRPFTPSDSLPFGMACLSGVPDPRIEEGVRQVDEQIDEDERERR